MERIFFIQSFAEAFEIRGWQFLLVELIFWLEELIFSHFSDTPPNESYFPSRVKVFLNESSNPYGVNIF